MEFTKEIGDIIFNNEYWKGGNGDNFKVPCSNLVTKDYDTAFSKYKFVCGKISQNVIMSDYDDNDAFECRLKIAKALKQHCIVIKSPNRGGHFYWFNQQQIPLNLNKQKTLLTLSPVDYKTGIKKIKSTGEIKEANCAGSISNPDGTLREVVYCNIKEDGTLDDIPFYDLILNSGEKFDFLNMGEGTGRQDGLYNYMIPVKKAGYSYEDFRTVAKLIDKFIFSKSLEGEFENAIRQEEWESVDKSYNTDGKFNHASFGDSLIEQYNFISVNGNLYTYSEGVYKQMDNLSINEIIVSKMPELRINQKREVIEFMRARCIKKVSNNNLKRVNVKNGILEFTPNKETKTFDIALLEHSPQIIDFKQFNAVYNPAIEYPLLDETLNKVFCGDAELVSLFDEIIGYLMMNHVNYHKCFFLVGKPSGGKSNILKMIINFIGKQNVSTLSLKDFNDKFRLASIVGKTANILADLDQTTVTESGNFKSLVTGDGITVEEKYGSSFTYYNTAKLIFSCNTLPHFVDKAGVMRRPIIIPFNHKFDKADADFNPFIDDDLATPECMSALLNRGIEGYKRLYLNGGFTEPVIVQNELNKFKVTNSNVLTWIDECEFDEDRLQREFIGDLYKMFSEWCFRNNSNPQSRRSFTDEICNEFNFSVGKQERIGGTNKRDRRFISDKVTAK